MLASLDVSDTTVEETDTGLGRQRRETMDSTLNDVGTVAVACVILQWQSREADPLSDQDDAATSSKRTPAHVASPSHREPAVENPRQSV